MALPAIELIGYDWINSGLGARVHSMVYGGTDVADPRLTVDFPELARRYATPDVAEATVRQVVTAIRINEGQFGAFAVTYAGAVIGVLTFEQKILKRRGRIFRTDTLANGPLLACWLADPARRGDAPRNLLPQVLRAAAMATVSNPALTGHPWTLVRADRNDRGHVDGCLQEPNNGFGGFTVQDQGEFSAVDGIRGVQRKLYVAAHPVETLRD